MVREVQDVKKSNYTNTIREILDRPNRGGMTVRVFMTTLFISILLLPLLQLLSPNSYLPTQAASISESYPTESNYPLGTLLSIKRTEPISVELANSRNNTYLTGVVVAEGESLLNINRDGGTIHVATSGDVEVFISDIGGDIEAGDFIGASWISGVAMRSEQTTEQRLLGVALQPFSEESDDTIELTDVETPDGTRDALVGKIVVRMFDRDVGTDTSLQVSGLEAMAQRVAGQNVAFTRVLMATGLFVISVIISGVFLANAIRGSFISLGRNPLAGESIFNSLMQISGVSIGLVIIGAFLAYLVLIM